MNDILGIIMDTKPDLSLGELTRTRNLPSVQFGGRYRLIDFPLSNMVLSGIKHVGVVIYNKYSTLLEHLGSGMAWGLDRKTDGLKILPTASPALYNSEMRFDLKDLSMNLDMIKKARQNYVLLTGCGLLYRIDYKQLLDAQVDKGADITILYKDEECDERYISNPERYQYLEYMNIGRDGRLLGTGLKPKVGDNHLSMETVILKKDLLIDCINLAMASGGQKDLCDIVTENIRSLRVYGHPFKGYAAKVNTILNYYDSNMELKEDWVRNALFYENGPVFTRSIDRPPTKYYDTAVVKDSIISSGCHLHGNVEGSILSRNTFIGEGSVVKNCVLLRRCRIEGNVHIENSILDSEVIISSGITLKIDSSGGRPLVVGKESRL